MNWRRDERLCRSWVRTFAPRTLPSVRRRALTSANTDTKNINLSFTAAYDPKTKFLFKSESLYLRGDADGKKQVDKATANARGEYLSSAVWKTALRINPK